MNQQVDWYFTKNKTWQDAIVSLRTIVLESGLKEELKWGVPCYTMDGANVVLIHVFKEYCALLFHKGVLLKDPKSLLIQQTENVQAARQIRFTHVQEIVKLKKVLITYIKEAIAIEKSGTKVPMKKTEAFKMPEEFKIKLNELPALKKAFVALTPGRQRGYLLYFSAAKQSATRTARVEKCLKKILEGKGLED